MFKINLRQLLRVLFILGLLLPTYVLPSSSTSNVAFAEGGLEDVEALEDVEGFELEERSGACKGLEICIRRINKPDFGEEMGRRLVIRGVFPKAMLKVTLRNSDGKIVYEQPIRHNGRNRVRVDLGRDFEWQEGSYTATVMLEGGFVGDSFDLDVKESKERFIRADRARVDIEKMIQPNVGELMSKRLKLTGNFPEGVLQVTLHNSEGEVVHERLIEHDGSKNLSVNVKDIDWEKGTYEIRIELIRNGNEGLQQLNRSLAPSANPFGSFKFGVDYFPTGWGRCW